VVGQTYREAQTLERAALGPACPREAKPNKASSLVKITADREPMRVEVVRAALSPFQLETPYCYGRVTAAWASNGPTHVSLLQLFAVHILGA